MNNQALNLLGIAMKAGRVEVGDEPVSSAARSHSARLIILASDAAPNIARKVRNLRGTGPVIVVPFTKDELGNEVGRGSCAVASFSDVRLARSFVEKLAEPEKYLEVLETLSQQAQRVDRRQAEKKAHEKNLHSGKRKSNKE